jgi:predicted DNA-binding transcriptional regulator AlpA
MPEGCPTEPGLLTPRQVADRLAVNVRTLWRMAEREGFPQPIRFNRKLVRWKAIDVQNYLDSLPNTDRSTS